jgi:hypothetical protein
MTENFFNFKIEYENKTEKIELSQDSEFFQLKMMICGKFKIYDISKCFIVYNTKVLDSISNDEIISNIFSIENENITLKVFPEYPKNEITKDYPLSIPIEKLTEYKIIYTCSCNSKNEASYVCLKCYQFICDFCKKREPHLLHNSNIIHNSRFPDFLKKHFEKLAVKLDEGILSDDTFIYLQIFKENLKSDIEGVSKTFDYLKNLLEEIKGMQINFLLELENKFSYSDKYSQINDQIFNLLHDFKSLSKHERIDDEILQKYRKITEESELLKSQYSAVCKNLNVYMSAINDFSHMNKQLNNIIKEKYLNSQTNFNILAINNRIAELNKSIFILDNFYLIF